MNYKNIALSEIQALADTFNEYSLGKVLLAITNRKPKNLTLPEWLYAISDEDLYTAIETTKFIEQEID